MKTITPVSIALAENTAGREKDYSRHHSFGGGVATLPI
jgi:hypothetical protein